jgi:hypothetical protein
MNSNRLTDLKRFYAILNALEKTIGGQRTLADCSGRLDWTRKLEAPVPVADCGAGE